MSATTLRLIGILFLVGAAVVAVLNLKRVANLGMIWLSAPLRLSASGWLRPGGVRLAVDLFRQ